MCTLELLHFAVGAFTLHLSGTRFFNRRPRGSPNGAWNKIVTHAPMKPNKTSHYRDEKLYHYHGNCEAHSQGAGWVTRKERVEENRMEKGKQGRGDLWGNMYEWWNGQNWQRGYWQSLLPLSDKCVKDSVSSQSLLFLLSHDNTPAQYFSLTLSMLTTN